MGDEYEQPQSVWNFDGAELFLIFQIKSRISLALESWDLKEAYKKIRLLRMELDAKLTRGQKKIIEEFEKKQGKQKSFTEKEEVDDMMNELDEAYNLYADIFNPTIKEQSDFYKLIEAFYMHLCYLMKKHGLYYREGEDSRLAVLRR